RLSGAQQSMKIVPSAGSGALSKSVEKSLDAADRSVCATIFEGVSALQPGVAAPHRPPAPRVSSSLVVLEGGRGVRKRHETSLMRQKRPGNCGRGWREMMRMRYQHGSGNSSVPDWAFFVVYRARLPESRRVAAGD